MTIKYLFIAIFFLSNCSNFQGSRTPDSLISYPQGLELFYLDGTPFPDYESRVENLSPGDKIKFPDGKSFTIHRRLGSGGTSLIFDIGDGKVLRIASNQWALDGDIIRDYLDFYQSLEDDLIPLVKVYPGESSKDGTYAVIKKVEEELNLYDYLKSGLRDEKKEKGLKKLLNAFAPYESFPDFREDQFVWDGKKWVMLDWTKEDFKEASHINAPFSAEEILKERPEYLDVFLEERAFFLEQELLPVHKEYWLSKLRPSLEKCQDHVLELIL